MISPLTVNDNLFMKNRILFFTLLLATSGLFAQVGIGTTTPVASAALDVTSTTKGFLPPRMTEAQRDDIASPATGLQVYCTDCGYNGGEPQYFNGDIWLNMMGTAAAASIWPADYVHCDPSNLTRVVEVLNPTTGKIWMDRNLGASRVATSRNDALAFGDLYQWGRLADGHQCRNSATDNTNILSSGNVPGHGNFIPTSALPFDWRVPIYNDLDQQFVPQEANLWQGDGINNPCPLGYRIPTETEIQEERLSWSTNNAAGAFASPLKLTTGAKRDYDGGLGIIFTTGYYWTSTPIDSYGISHLKIQLSNSFTEEIFRANGLSVRCIKD
jgi:hypothetical protein